MDSVRTCVAFHVREGSGIKAAASSYPKDAAQGWLTIQAGESDVTFHGLTDEQMMLVADRIYQAVRAKNDLLERDAVPAAG